MLMIRQLFNYTSQPFKKNIIVPGAVILAVDYDLGRNGIAYYDMDTVIYRISTGKPSMGNYGGMYRNDGEEIFQTSDLESIM